MPSPAAIQSRSIKAGTCPHGLPLGACPICNGMAGGNSTTKRDVPRNVGEMTYNQCAAIGAMLKAQKHAKEQTKIAQQNYLQALAEFSKNIANTHQKLMDLAALITKTTPAIIAKPVNFVLTVLVAKVLHFVQSVPNIIQSVVQKFVDIYDKLAAVYGEFKAAVKERIQKFITDTKKKLKSIFFVFGADEMNDEEKKIDEAKRIFDLKTFVHKLAQKLKNEGENAH
ncbi:MAG: hypothetical protein NC191_05700 [Muribaculaceae bacterium]|nr:hypothetical protein [Muribaculaceae bacterium]